MCLAAYFLGIYLRTTKRRNADGSETRYYQLAENEWDAKRGCAVAKVKQDLRGWRLGRCVFVGDAGMNSADNRRTLALGNGKYILGSRMRAGDEVTHQVLARQGRNIVARLEKIQVVEYDRGEARIRQTTEVRPEADALLKKLRVAPPPKLHSVESAPPAEPVTSGDA